MSDRLLFNNNVMFCGCKRKGKMETEHNRHEMEWNNIEAHREQDDQYSELAHTIWGVVKRFSFIYYTLLSMGGGNSFHGFRVQLFLLLFRIRINRMQSDTHTHSIYYYNVRLLALFLSIDVVRQTPTFVAKWCIENREQSWSAVSTNPFER